LVITKPNGSRFVIDRHTGYQSWISNTNCRNPSDPWEYFQFQNYFDDDGSGFTQERADFFYDDIYLQFGTQARVEIGNQPDYSSCDNISVQRPLNWGTGSIDVELNFGAFSPGSTVYVFVVGENGLVSAGHPITLQ
ncbi:MAG: hypothetical protein HKO53_04025, partial [Gemmatimonadetes bacterium]|nr:hypothetical protein [Gemmatimonadota bacterium]